MPTFGEAEEQRGPKQSLFVARLGSQRRSGTEHDLENENRRRRNGGDDLYGGVEVEGGGGGGGDHKDIVAGRGVGSGGEFQIKTAAPRQAFPPTA